MRSSEELLVRLWRSRPGSTLIDVGAYAGDFTRAALREGASKVIAYEPQILMSEKLIPLFAKDGLDSKLTVRNVALMNFEGESTIKIPVREGEGGLATLGEARRFEIFNIQPVHVTTLDNNFLPENWDRVDLLKIDVEGAELFVLKGGVKTIARYRPVIFLEYTELNTVQFGYKPQAIADLLLAWSYRVEQVAPWDLWAVPSEMRKL